MNNPFDLIENRLTNIETLLLDIKQQRKSKTLLRKYNVQEASDICRCSKLTIYSRIRKGDIKAERFGRRYLIPHSELFDDKNIVKSLKYKRNM